MVFNSNNWQEAITGIDPELIASVERWALRLSSELPSDPKLKDLRNPKQANITMLASCLDDVKKASPKPELLSGSSLSPARLTIWALGLARHLTGQTVVH